MEFVLAKGKSEGRELKNNGIGGLVRFKNCE